MADTTKERRKVTVLNPACTNNAVARVPLAVDIGWGGPEAAYDVFQVVAERFNDRFPGITTKVVRKNGFFAADDPELWEEIKAKGDAAVLGISC